MAGDQITYVPGAVADFAAGVGNYHGVLQDIHDDAMNRTNALAEFFQGVGADGFFDAQAQMLTGLQGLVDTVGQHGVTTTHVLENAIATDQHIRGLF